MSVPPNCNSRYGLVGSTEFGEDFSQWLKDHVVAYLNIDVGAAGSYYGLNASPSLADLLRNVSAAVEDPEQPGRSLLDRAAAEEQNTLSEQQHAQTLGAMTQGVGKDLKIGALGSGSDFTVMLQHLGLASANVGFSRKSTDPVYMYHSSYDSAAWMDRFGDTNFKRHDAIARVLGLTALRLADSIILPINVTGKGRPRVSTTLSTILTNWYRHSLCLRARNLRCQSARPRIVLVRV